MYRSTGLEASLGEADCTNESALSFLTGDTMGILNKPIGKYVLLIVVGLGAVLLIIGSSVLTGLSPADRTLTETGNILPSMSLILGSSYVARQRGIGCKAWSLFGGCQLKHSGERRIAEVADGKLSVTLLVEDRSDGRCGYTFQGVSMGIARKGESTNRISIISLSRDPWKHSFAYVKEHTFGARPHAHPDFGVSTGAFQPHRYCRGS